MIPGLSSIASNAASLINKLVSDKDLAAKLALELQTSILVEGAKILQSEVDAQQQAITAEARGESFLQRNWRPLLMCVFMVIIANNYIVAPYVKLIWPAIPFLETPEQMWTLITLAVSGYVTGRSAEKIFEKIWSKK